MNQDKIKSQVQSLLSLVEQLPILEKLMLLYSPKNSEIPDKDTNFLAYWKDVLFAALATFLIILFAPAFLYGAVLFFSKGAILLGVAEISSYVIMVLILINDYIAINFKKYTILAVLYGLGIMLLIFTGPFGAGMILILFSLILSALMFESKEVNTFFAINLGCFFIITYALLGHRLDNFPIAAYKSTWWINLISIQFIAIILFYMVQMVTFALNQQNIQLFMSKKMINQSDIKHRSLITSLNDMILVIDKNLDISYESPNISAKYNLVSPLKNLKELNSLFTDSEPSKVSSEYSSLLEHNINQILAKSINSVTFNVNTAEGRHYEITAQDMTEDENINGILISLYDITTLVEREREILYLYERDPLTGLRNRQKLEWHINNLRKIEKLPLSIIYGDINGLKLVNDSLGHIAGDAMLKNISEIITLCIEPDTLVFRIGGDEILIFQENSSELQCQMLIARIHAMCESYNVKTTFPLNDSNADQSDTAILNHTPVYLSISLGYEIIDDLDTSIDVHIYKAEESMYLQKHHNNRKIHSDILDAMLKVLHEKSPGEADHGNRLIKYSRVFGKSLNLSAEQILQCEQVAKLHDIGKVGIESKILEKSTILTKEDWIHLKRHPEVGYRIALNSHESGIVAEAIYTHHEKWDGTGYPRGLSGEDIPLIARIISILDTYDAMTHNQSFRSKRNHKDAIDEILAQRGLQFDPMLVDAFISLKETTFL